MKNRVKCFSLLHLLIKFHGVNYVILIIQIKPFHQYNYMAIFMVCSASIRDCDVNEILWCDDSSPNSFPPQLYINTHVAIYLACKLNLVFESMLLFILHVN